MKLLMRNENLKILFKNETFMKIYCFAMLKSFFSFLILVTFYNGNFFYFLHFYKIGKININVKEEWSEKYFYCEIWVGRNLLQQFFSFFFSLKKIFFFVYFFLFFFSFTLESYVLNRFQGISHLNKNHMIFSILLRYFFFIKFRYSKSSWVEFLFLFTFHTLSRVLERIERSSRDLDLDCRKANKMRMIEQKYKKLIELFFLLAFFSHFRWELKLYYCQFRLWLLLSLWI